MIEQNFPDGKAIPHPDQVLKALLGQTKDKQIVGSLGSRRNLELVHKACREQYEAGSLDFSPSALAKSLSELG